MTTLRHRLLAVAAAVIVIPGALFWLAADIQILRLRDRAIELARDQNYEEARARVEQEVQEMSRRLGERLRFFEESAADLASETARSLAASGDAAGDLPAADASGLIASARPEDGTVAFIARPAAADSEAKSLYLRSRAMARAFADEVRRRPEIELVYLWTRAGAFRAAPWFDPGQDAARNHPNLLDRPPALAEWPRRKRPDDGPDKPFWTDPYAEPLEGGAWVVTVECPIRDEHGEVFAALAYDIPVKRLVDLPDSPVHAGVAFGVATSDGTTIAANAEGKRFFSRSSSTASDGDGSEAARFRSEILSSGVPRGRYLFGNESQDVIAHRVAGTDWAVVASYRRSVLRSASKLSAIRDADLGWRRTRLNAALIFVTLVAASLFWILRLARRFSHPFERLSQAALAVEEGRTADVPDLLPTGGPAAEIAKLAESFRAMSAHVHRRVSLLSSLRDLSRRAGSGLDLSQTAARIAEIVATALDARACIIHIYDPREGTLETVIPAHGVPDAAARSIRIPVDGGSIAASVFRTGEAYFSNDMAANPSATREIVATLGIRSALFAPLRDEEESIGILVVLDRPGGFREEDREDAIAFADSAAVLIRRAMLHRTLQDANAELRRASYVREHFLQNVNHELRTPLTSILGWSEMLDQADTPERLRETGLRQIRQSSNSLLMLIDDLLDLSRLEHGAFRLQREKLDANLAVRHAVESLQGAAKSRGIAILGPVEDGPPAAVEADPLRLQQVLWNLINNALKFTRRGGTVRAGVEAGGETVLVYVEDNGIGIPADELPHVFDRFRQVDPSVTREQPGMGIGLSISKTIIERHGGEIWARSEPGRGSRFAFTLPRAL